jgi:hypothetical protein
MASSRQKFPWYRRVFFGIMLIVQLSIIWPGFALFSAAEPLILGFPLSFAWLIAMLLLGFAAFIGLYIMDNRREDAAESEARAAMPSSQNPAGDASAQKESSS